MAMQHKGFTIIEVILFLAITGVVMSAMLVGVGAGLNHQKYRDATNELMSYVQDQYNLVGNVNNSRAQTDVCANGRVTKGTVRGEGAGRSDCTIVGRLLQSTDGQSITAAKVIATVDALNLPRNPADSDIKILRDAGLTLDPNKEIYQPPWGTRVVAPGNHQPASFSLLIIRMPTSGVVHTYVASSGSGSTTPAVVVGNYSQPRELKLCLDPKGLLGVSSQAIGTRIAPDAANSGGVTFVSQGDC